MMDNDQRYAIEHLKRAIKHLDEAIRLVEDAYKPIRVEVCVDADTYVKVMDADADDAANGNILQRSDATLVVVIPTKIRGIAIL